MTKRDMLSLRSMGIAKSLKKVMDRLMADDQRAKKLAQAVGSVQRGKKAFDRGQEELMRSLSVATRGDFKAVGKKLAGLKRRARELDQKLDGASRGAVKAH